LRRGGRAARLKPVTRQDLERRYGYYLTHLAEIGQLDPAAPAGAQVQPGAVQGFVERGRTIWRPVTLTQSVKKLKRMAQILAPERDHGWLAEIANDLSLGAEPKARFDRIVLSSELVEARLTLVREAERAVHRRRRWRAAQMRSGGDDCASGALPGAAEELRRPDARDELLPGGRALVDRARARGDEGRAG
jgi:hypothetical protein